TVLIGRIHTEDGPRYVANPTVSQLEFSDLDMVLAGHKDGVNMIEVGAAEVDEAGVLGAIEFGMDYIKQTLELIDELVAKAGKEKKPGELALPPEDIVAIVKKACEEELTQARQIPGKNERNDKVAEIRDRMLDEHFPLKLDGGYGEYAESLK